VATLESQLNDTQEAIQEETRQKLAAQARVKQAEEQAAIAREQAEDEEASRKSLEMKIANLNSQVRCDKSLITYVYY